MSTTELAIAEQQSMVMTPQQALGELRQLQEFVKSVMVEKVDYGVIPGTGGKNVLLKPGAEKLCEVYGYAPHVEIIEQVQQWTATPPFFHYLVRAALVRKSNGVTVAEGVGSCNSMESKYRYRLEKDWHNTQPAGEGWIKKTSNDQKKLWWQRRVVNEDTADLANTILKMAKKRALIDATLSATRSSELFTQDMEDFTDAEYTEHPAEEAKPAAKHPTKGKTAKPSESGDYTCTDCGQLIEGYTTKTGREYTADEVVKYSVKDYHRRLCRACGWKAKEAKEQEAVTEPDDGGAVSEAEVLDS